MERLLVFLYRLCCAGLLGAQVFFAAAAAQVAFSRGLPRPAAGDLVGAMLARLDAAGLVLTAAAVVCAIALRRNRAAILPLLAGLCAFLSTAFVTPAVHAMRLAGEAGGPRFGRLHAISSGLLLLEMALLAVAAWRAPEPVRSTAALR